MVAAPLSAQDTATKPAPSDLVSASARDAGATVDAFHAALRRGDTAAVAALLADNALIFESGEAERSKRESKGRLLPCRIASPAAAMSVSR